MSERIFSDWEIAPKEELKNYKKKTKKHYKNGL